MGQSCGPKPGEKCSSSKNTWAVGAAEDAWPAVALIRSPPLPIATSKAEDTTDEKDAKKRRKATSAPPSCGHKDAVLRLPQDLLLFPKEISPHHGWSVANSQLYHDWGIITKRRPKLAMAMYSLKTSKYSWTPLDVNWIWALRVARSGKRLTKHAQVQTRRATSRIEQTQPHGVKENADKDTKAATGVLLRHSK